jgi:multidrug efflux pump subunit AcrA (membrane-fusion protein)
MNPMTESSMVTEPLVDDRSRELNGSPIDPQLSEHAGANKSVVRRLVRALMWGAVLLGGVVFGLYKKRVDIPQLNTPKIYAYLDSMVMRAEQIKGRVVGHSESTKQEGEEAHHEHKIWVTSPMAKDVIITQEYVCQIHSRKHIDVCALEDGYLEAIPIREGQAVKKGDVLFEVVPVLYKARLDAKVAERDLAQLELNNTRRLAEKNAVSPNEVKLFEAKLARTQAEVDLAMAELNFTKVTARFDGIVDRLKVFQGSLVKEGDILTTLSDNSVMWVYFNVPEKRYLEYMAETSQGFDLQLKSWGDGSGVPTSGKRLAIVGIDNNGLVHIRTFDAAGVRTDAFETRDSSGALHLEIADASGTVSTDELGSSFPPTQADAITTLKQLLPSLLPPRVPSSAERNRVLSAVTSIVGPDIELRLANFSKFPHIGKIGAIEAKFDNTNGNIPFRADFPNPESLLRHGQTGKVLINRVLHGATVIPQRATFENLAKKYVFVVDKDDVVHQREIEIQHELEDIYVIGKELDVNDKIVFEGIRQVHEDLKVEFEFRQPEQVMANQKNKAE